MRTSCQLSGHLHQLRQTEMGLAAFTRVSPQSRIYIKARFPLPELTDRVDGPITRLVETRARQHGLC